MADPSIISQSSKFRGCLIGSHVGDCLGCPFELERTISKEVLKNFFTKLLDVEEKSDKVLPYTDDTAMALNLGKSLVEKKGFDGVDMARRFTEEYFRQPSRSYGKHVVAVFHALSKSNYEDVFEPAKQQFKGTGSFGNGAAMRIAPAALYCYNKPNEMLEVVKSTSSVTHTHQVGYNGAILQCLAIDQALRMKSEESIDPIQFINNLLNHMEKIEEEITVSKKFKYTKPFCSRLQKMKTSFENGSQPWSAETVVEILGNNVTAHKSVPSAIYSFLRGLNPLDNFDSDNPFVRSMYFAISLGNDTDTIAAMTGSIAGAFHGEEMIPEILQKKCESLDESKNLADELYNLCCGSEKDD